MSQRSAFPLALHGAGMIAGAHVAAASLLRLPVVAVASRSRERAVDLATRAEATPVTYEALPGGADGVIVCTPPADHAAATVRLLAAGAAVMVEKPLAATLVDADAIETATARSGERMLYAENLAYAPVVRRLLAQRRRLGQLSFIEARALTPRPTWGGFLGDAWGGGVLFDLGVHPLALALLVAGGPPVGVRAQLDGGADHATDEHAVVDLRFADGVRARVVASWRETTGVVWDVQAAGQAGVVRADLMPEPALERDGVAVPLAPLRTASPAIEGYGYLDQLAAFVADMQAGRRPFMAAAFGRTVLEVVCAAYTSAGRGGAEQPFPFNGPRDRTPLELWRAG